MTQAAAHAVEESSERISPDSGSLRLRAAHFWIQALVQMAEQSPRAARALRPLGLWWTWRSSATIRGATRANAARIAAALAQDGVNRDPEVLARRMVGTFYDFLMDMGRNRGRSAQELVKEIDGATGVDRYRVARAARKGAIIVTAHIGSFEVGAAAIREWEPRVHVVFQRDPIPVFERLRSEQRTRLGLIESPVDPARGEDTWNVWLRLRDALRADEVVLLQGDRVMPGQRGRKVAFMGGHVMLPPGPVKLALASGAPIIPVCAPRMPGGRLRIVMEEPIWVEAQGPVDQPHEAEVQLAHILDGWLRQYPEQWMMITRAWCEDQG